MTCGVFLHSLPKDRRQTLAKVSLEADVLRGSGEWTVFHLHAVEQSLSNLSWPGTGTVQIDMHDVSALDTAGAWLLHRTAFQLTQTGLSVFIKGLSPKAQTLYEYVSRRGGVPGQLPKAVRPGPIERIGRSGIEELNKNIGLLAFIGETAATAAPLLLSPLRVRWQMVLRELGEAGYKALPIVGMLAFLLGVVIAYQGGDQLRLYGANIFIADLVGLSMLRELAPLIAAIIVAGRTGSAYTAQIGTMKVTDEIDALRTMAITPIEWLVIPKLIALVIALPLLTVYADIMGIFGGMVMANVMLGLSMPTFLDRLVEAVSLQSYLTGLGKAPVFAIIIAMVGCFQGFQVAGSAESVGRQTTISVVQSIFWVIVIDALFSVAFSQLGL